MQNIKRQRLTQKEIATRLGVSVATVSLALSNSPLVAAETREKILKAAKDDGYLRNRAAASLRTGSTKIIGVSFHDIVHPFFAEMLAEMEQQLAASGEAIFINNHADDREKQARFVNSLRELGADGLIVSPALGSTDQDFQHFEDSGGRIVTIVRRIAAGHFDYVVNNDLECMRIAADHLISLGHRDIVMLGGLPGTSTADGRFDGFVHAMAKLDPEANWRHSWFPGPAKRVEGVRLTVDAFNSAKTRPTGIVCLNDLVAFGAMAALSTMGLKTGRDVAVVGIDDSDEAAASHPGLTTVSNKSSAIASEAIRLLRRRQQAPLSPQEGVELSPTLIIRESCGPMIKAPRL